MENSLTIYKKINPHHYSNIENGQALRSGIQPYYISSWYKLLT